jgi:hypothetical protein
MVQMSIVDVINMTFVFDRGVATPWSMLMTLVGMGLRFLHKNDETNKMVLNQVNRYSRPSRSLRSQIGKRLGQNWQSDVEAFCSSFAVRRSQFTVRR